MTSDEWIVLGIETAVDLLTSWPLLLLVVVVIFRGSLAQAVHAVADGIRNREVKIASPVGHLELGSLLKQDIPEPEPTSEAAEALSPDADPEEHSQPQEIAIQVLTLLAQAAKGDERLGRVARSPYIEFTKGRLDPQLAAVVTPLHPADGLIAAVAFTARRHGLSEDRSDWVAAARMIRKAGYPVLPPLDDAQLVEIIEADEMTPFDGFPQIATEMTFRDDDHTRTTGFRGS